MDAGLISYPHCYYLIAQFPTILRTSSCYEPQKESVVTFDYRKELQVENIAMFKGKRLIWAMIKSLCDGSEKDSPTSSGYNSLISDIKPKTTVAMLPITPGSPTEWENLYTAIKVSSELNYKLNAEGKTVISFDLHLYIKAVLLQNKCEIKENFIFRMGELHTVFCFLRVFGKFIDGNGLDQMFEEFNSLWFFWQAFHED